MSSRLKDKPPNTSVLLTLQVVTTARGNSNPANNGKGTTMTEGVSPNIRLGRVTMCGCRLRGLGLCHTGRTGRTGGNGAQYRRKSSSINHSVVPTMAPGGAGAVPTSYTIPIMPNRSEPRRFQGNGSPAHTCSPQTKSADLAQWHEDYVVKA